MVRRRAPDRRQASCTRWEQVGRKDVQRWIVWLLERYSSAYASNQYRALQQFFRWLAAEEELPDPMDGMRPPRVPGKPVPVFTGEDLSRLERARAGRSFQQRRDAAVIAVFRATGIRLSELAQIRYDHHDPQRSDIDLELREITVHGKGQKTRAVKISFGAARSIDRYLRARARHAQAYRPQLRLAVGNRGPMTASGIQPPHQHERRQHRMRHPARTAPNPRDEDLPLRRQAADMTPVTRPEPGRTRHDGHCGRGTFTARPISAYASTVSGHGHTMDMANHRLKIPSRDRHPTRREGISTSSNRSTTILNRVRHPRSPHRQRTQPEPRNR